MARLIQIDELNIADQYYLNLEKEQNCYFLRRYTSGQDYSFSETNQLIKNFKIAPSVKAKNPYKYQHKGFAMTKIIAELQDAVSNVFALENCTLVPIPPSKSQDHDDYDPRMTTVLNKAFPQFDVRELIVVNDTMDAFHDGNRLPPEELIKRLTIDKKLTKNLQPHILLFDDLVTTGSHFIACRDLIREQLPAINDIFGIFVARVDRDEIETE